MRRWMIAAVLAAGVALVATGCMNVSVPDGPYVKLDDSLAPTGTPGKSNAKFTRDFLKDAKENGVITESQYKELTRRLDSACRL